MAKVIYTHVFETWHGATFVNEIQYFDKCLTFLFGGMCPNFFVLERAIRFLPGKSVQVFKAFIGSVRVAFDVVEQVTGVRGRQQVEPTEVFERQQKFRFWQCVSVEFAVDSRCVLQLSLATQAV